MPADYNIPMTDAQITEALQLMVERVSEGWAQETYDGSPVGSGSPYYHKSSKWWATQAADAAARAEAAVPAGTAGAVFFDRAQTLTDAQKAQARQNIMAGGSNRNLLDNPFFQVNQRGFTSSTGTNSVRTVDRWRINNGQGGTTTVQADGSILFDANAQTSYISFQQEINLGVPVGTQLTASALFADGSIVSCSGAVPTRTTAYQQFSYNSTTKPGFSIAMNATPSSVGYDFLIQIVCGNGYSWNIKAIKVEVGTTSTLANDAPPCYAEELAKCQRYDRRYESRTGYVYLTTAIATAANTARAVLEGNLRDASRTVTFSNVTLTDGSTSYPVTAISSVSYGGGYTNINITSSGLTVGKVYYLQLAPAGYINLSADL